MVGILIRRWLSPVDCYTTPPRSIILLQLWMTPFVNYEFWIFILWIMDYECCPLCKGQGQQLIRGRVCLVQLGQPCLYQLLHWYLIMSGVRSHNISGPRNKWSKLKGFSSTLSTICKKESRTIDIMLSSVCDQGRGRGGSIWWMIPKGGHHPV